MQEKIENLLNETEGELIRAFNSGYLWEWLQSNELNKQLLQYFEEINQYKGEVQ